MNRFGGTHFSRGPGGTAMRMTVWLVLLGMNAVTGASAQETPSPALLVLLKGENAMVIVDPANGKVAGRVPTTGQDPHELAVSDDGKLAFASNYSGNTAQGGNSISVIDIAARKTLHRVDLTPLGRPHGLWFADGKLYFTVEANMAIGRYDPAANKVDWILGTGQDRTHMILVTKDLKTIFTSNVSSNTISIIERGSSRQGPPGGRGGPPPPGGPGGGPPPGGPRGGPPGGPGWKHTVVSVGRGPEGFDLSPDGKEIWTAHMNDGGVSVIDVATKKVARTIDVGARAPNRLKFTTDGRLALISEIAGGGLVVVDTASGTVKKRLSLGRGASGILVPPDGSHAYVALTGSNAVAVIDLKTLEETNRFSPGPGPDGMAWLEIKR
jgi:YVTN family beta-propeller protein